uniref:Uncharacterized protein n=1 Tax=Siphoviridae sp. ctkTz2 TaxID=2827923 RepID=A0A8S5S679_9CAUD|nr:MAG TPA: hypothetical protein [Siphoviridae sp. ctkTz2]
MIQYNVFRYRKEDEVFWVKVELIILEKDEKN